MKRDMRLVPFDPRKIENAIGKALIAGGHDPAAGPPIAERVMEAAVKLGQAFVHVEDVQDLVQAELMRAGVAGGPRGVPWFKVAEAYIVYRAKRAAARDAGETKARDEASQTECLTVLMRDGSNVLWTAEDLRARIRFAMGGLDLCLSESEIEIELRRSLSDGIKKEDLDQTLLLNAKTLQIRDADFAKFTGRFFLTFIYEEVLGWNILRDGPGTLRDFHRRKFRTNLERMVKIERLSPKLLDMDISTLAECLDPSADYDFESLGIQTLYDRYLIIDKTCTPARRLETPQFFWMRVAMGLYLEEETGREGKAASLYDLYKSRRFCSSTPTLFNSGTLRSQLSSCYLYYVDDTIESIMQRGIAENAYLSKWAGGLGGSWTSVRGTGAHIAGTNGESQGVIPFLKLHNDQLVAVNQGGKRRGSGCAYLETWHNDIFEFLELRKNVGDDRRRTHDMNTANWIPDLFMKRVEGRQKWTLFRSSDVKDLHHLYGRRFEEKYVEYEKLVDEGKIIGQKVEALDLWKKMLSMLFETGHPWITFKDACNIRSPQDHAGVIHSSNLCSEITLNTSNDETAVCNLGSIVLENHVTKTGEIDMLLLRETVRLAVRALDNVIDINFYPTESARNANMRHRPIGLGVMGLHYALLKKGLAFASQEAVEFSDQVMEAVAYFAYEASSDLAAERGCYSSYKGSKWDRGLLPQDTVDMLAAERGVPVDVPRNGRMDWAPLRVKIAAQGMRNSNVLAIAPTATISNIMGSSPCIEPLYKNLYNKSNLSGESALINPYLVVDLKALGEWDEGMQLALLANDGALVPQPGVASVHENRLRLLPASLKEKYQTAFDIDFKWILEAAARRQKWIDQAQSLNLWLKSPDMKTLSHMYRSAWHLGLKTTYYLRTLEASSIEKSTVEKNLVRTGQFDNPTTCSLDAIAKGECTSCQ
jgi:ribonucleoside-diphosphate reductase alpha chain